MNVEVFEKTVEIKNNVEHNLIIVRIDGNEEIVGEVFRISSGYQFVPKFNLKHFKWIQIGNACFEYEDELDACKGTKELKEKAIAVYQDGTTYYLLLPKE